MSLRTCKGGSVKRFHVGDTVIVKHWYDYWLPKKLKLQDISGVITRVNLNWIYIEDKKVNIDKHDIRLISYGEEALEAMKEERVRSEKEQEYKKECTIQWIKKQLLERGICENCISEVAEIVYEYGEEKEGTNDEEII